MKFAPSRLHIRNARLYPVAIAGGCGSVLLGALLTCSTPTPVHAADYSKEIQWNNGSPQSFPVNLHFNQAGQSRSVEVKAETGYVFKEAFTLVSPNPLPSDLRIPGMTNGKLPAAGLSSKEITFQWLAPGAAQDHEISVTLHNVLVPSGGGGGGPPPEKPFDLVSFLYFVYCKLQATDSDPQAMKDLYMAAGSTTNVVARLVMGNGKVPDTTSTLQLAVPTALGTVTPAAATTINGQGKVPLTITAANAGAGPQNITLSNPSLWDESVAVSLTALPFKIPMASVVVEVVRDEELWWFNGALPQFYPTVVTLRASGVSSGTFKWDVVGGQDKVNFENGQDSITKNNQNTVRLVSTDASSAPKDVKIQFTYNGGILGNLELFVYAPQRLEFREVVHRPYRRSGYRSIIRYIAVDNAERQMRFRVPVTEQFTTRDETDRLVLGDNWPQPNEGGAILSPNNIYDVIQIEITGLLANPTSQHPHDPPLWDMVDHWLGNVLIGSVVPGRGRIVKPGNKWQRYRDHGDHAVH